MKNELPAYEYTDPKIFWRDVVERLDLSEENILPVLIMDKKTQTEFGRFFVSLCYEDRRKYVQFENFSSPELGIAVIENIDADWIVYPGGIYRIEF